MYGGFTYAGGTFAGDLFIIEHARRGAGVGIGGSGFPKNWFDLLDADALRKIRRREQIVAMREDEDSLMGV